MSQSKCNESKLNSAAARSVGLWRRFGQRLDRISGRYKIALTVGFCLSVVALTYDLEDNIAALGNWGYLGAFLINGIANATIVLPAPGGAVIAIMARDFNPLLIGIVAGAGGALGGSTAYLAGTAATHDMRRASWYVRLNRFMARFGGLVIFFFSLVPFMPGDLASIVAGSVRYSFKKYLALNALGNICKMIAIAYLGADLLTWAEELLQSLVHRWF